MPVKRYTDVAFEAVTAFLLMGMVALTLLQVVTRYGLHAGFEWTEELARLDLIYLTFFGSIVAFQRREHLCIETLVHALPPRVCRWLRVAVDLVSMVVLGVVVWQGVPLLKGKGMTVIQPDLDAYRASTKDVWKEFMPKAWGPGVYEKVQAVK